jgi:hypothetical protein
MSKELSAKLKILSLILIIIIIIAHGYLIDVNNVDAKSKASAINIFIQEFFCYSGLPNSAVALFFIIS